MPVDQTRYVSAEASYFEGAEIEETDEEFIEAVDFGPFDATASAEVAGGAAWAAGNARQRSQFASDLIHLSAELDMAAEGFVGETGGFGEVDSYTQFTFAVDEPLTYTLSGYFSARMGEPYDTHAWSYVELEDQDGGQVFYCFFDDPEEPTPVDFFDSGTLPPGMHMLTAVSHADVEEAYDLDEVDSELSLDFTVVPEPATLPAILVGILLRGRRRR